MSNPDLKKSVYFPEKMMNEINRESRRQDRTVSWLLQRAWMIARAEIMGLETVTKPNSGSNSGNTPSR